MVIREKIVFSMYNTDSLLFQNVRRKIMQEKLFLIHGLFMHGTIMQYMQRHLKKYGYDVQVFSYRTVSRPLHQNAEKLADFIKEKRQSNDVCHFVGHSLGGLLIRLAYELVPEEFNGRIVTAGTPHNGSEVAHRVANELHLNILGGAYEGALDGDLPEWQGSVELGSIAGNKCIGVGMALPDLEKPNDGTVTVSETKLINQTDHIVLPLSHTALVYSKQVIKQTNYFLQNGKFNHS